MSVSFDYVNLKVPEDANVILGQAHFVKTVEDLFEVLAGIEDQADAAQRHTLLRELGYKL